MILFIDFCIKVIVCVKVKIIYIIFEVRKGLFVCSFYLSEVDCVVVKWGLKEVVIVVSYLL